MMRQTFHWLELQKLRNLQYDDSSIILVRGRTHHAADQPKNWVCLNRFGLAKTVTPQFLLLLFGKFIIHQNYTDSHF